MINKQFDLFLLGKDYNAQNLFGSHLLRNEKGEIYATRFRIYAPHAKEVRLISSHNNYEGYKHVLTKVNDQGLFEITIFENLEWVIYKYEIHTFSGEVLYKSDPFAFFSEERPSNGSKVYDIEGYKWNDFKWRKNKKPVYNQPVLIYEMHLGSWKRAFGSFRKYNDIVSDLINYLQANNFTHVEFLPLYEHPLDDSWGYQGTGFFAATSRYGSPKDLMYLIDCLHQANIGVLIDWVLGHINKDSHGLSNFDGTYLYENENTFLRENKVWGTNNLDFGKGITRSFMTSALTFWVNYFHVDGFRIDAVSNLIYHLGNSDVGENKAAISYLKELSAHLFTLDPNIIFSAEDSTSYPLVTHPVHEGGLGFNYKWNMGFMNDTLKYFKKDPIHRKHHSNLITFSMIYAYNENFILPFSHDEVVHMKGSLANKMPGDLNLKLKGWRLLLTYQMTFPGKKLLFMGQEFASFSEWNNDKELDWYLLNDKKHREASTYFKDLTSVYKHHNALYEFDHNPKGFTWLINDHHSSSVFAYLRESEDEMLVVILNMTPNFYEAYEVGVPFKGTYIEILNSDKDLYGGDNQYNGLPLKTIDGTRNNQPNYLLIKVPSLSALILKYKKE